MDNIHNSFKLTLTYWKDFHQYPNHTVCEVDFQTHSELFILILTMWQTCHEKAFTITTEENTIKTTKFRIN